jgi:hypothetical protein
MHYHSSANYDYLEEKTKQHNLHKELCINLTRFYGFSSQKHFKRLEPNPLLITIKQSAFQHDILFTGNDKIYVSLNLNSLLVPHITQYSETKF